MEIDKLKQCNDLSKMLGEAQKNMRTGELFYDSKQK